MNIFGEEGGFNGLLESIKIDKKLSLDQFMNIFEIIHYVHNFFHSSFSKTYLREFIDASINFIKDFVRTSERNF